MTTPDYTISYCLHPSFSCKGCTMYIYPTTLFVENNANNTFYHPACIRPVPRIEELVGWQHLDKNDIQFLKKLLAVDYTTWRVVELKERLRSIGLRVGGTKNTLIRRLKEYDKNILLEICK